MPMLILVSVFLLAGCVTDITTQPVHKTKTIHSNVNSKSAQQNLLQDGVPIVNLMTNKGGKDA